MNSTNDRIRLAVQAYELGDLQKAEYTLCQSLNDLESLHATNTSVSAEIFHILANVYRDLDKFSAADANYALSLEVTEKATGPSDNLMRVYRDFATSLCLQGRFNEAASIELHALVIARQRVKRHTYEVHFSVSRLCAFYLLSHDYSHAEMYYRRYVSQRKQTGVGCDLKFARVLADFALILYRQEKFAEAELTYKQALAVMEQSGVDEKDKMHLLNALGLSICAQHRHTEAQPWCARAAAARDLEEMTVTDGIHEVADTYCAKREFFQAQVLCEAALSAQEAGSYNSHPMLADALQRYMELVSSLNFFEKTEKIQARIERLRAQSA